MTKEINNLSTARKSQLISYNSGPEQKCKMKAEFVPHPLYCIYHILPIFKLLDLSAFRIVFF